MVEAHSDPNPPATITARTLGPSALALRPSLRAMLLGLLGLGYLIWQCQPASLGVYAYRYDEGVYAQTAWALQRGHTLYTEIFNSQAPLAPYLLAGLFQVTGPSIMAARVFMVLLSLGALVGVALMAARGAGWLAAFGAVLLLAFSPQFMLEARTVSPEAPVVALMYLAFGLAVYAGRSRPVWWLAVGLLIGLASLTKLSAVVLFPALAFVILAGHWTRRRVALAARDLILFTGPICLLWGLVLATADRTQLIDQVFTYHERARDVWRLSVAENLRQVVDYVVAYPLPWLFAVIGGGTLWRRRQRALLVAVLIAVAATLAALLTHTPLWPHHLVLLLPPVVALGGVGVQTALQAATALTRRRLSAARDPAIVVPVVVLIGALGLTPHVVATGSRLFPDADASWAGPGRAVAVLQAIPSRSGIVITDDQMAAFVAGKSVPPALVDTSYVRIETDYLDGATGVRAAEAAPPDAVLFWTRRLHHVRDLRRWVRSHYQRVETFGRDQELYLPR